MVTYILKVFNFDVYALLDPGSNLSIVTPFLSTMFDMSLEILLESFSVYTPMGKSVVDKRVYQNCLV